MRVKSLGKNITEIQLNNTIVLVSYETPVALVHPIWHGKEPRALKTSEFHSITTSKHINQWLKNNGINSDEVKYAPQKYFNGLLE